MCRREKKEEKKNKEKRTFFSITNTITKIRFFSTPSVNYATSPAVPSDSWGITVYQNFSVVTIHIF
jgi:hypothetical protein